MNYKIHLPIPAFCVLLLQACAAPPAPPTSPDVLAQAATSVLEEAVYFSTLFSSCASLGGEIEIDAISKQQDWLNTNNQLLLSADQLYSQQQSANTFEYQGKTLAPAAIKLAREAKQRALKELALNQRTPLNQIKTCEFRLGKINPASISLAQLPNIAPYASELLTHLPLDQVITNLPSLAGGITEVVPGATYYKLAKEHEEKCPAGFTLSIVNHWPKEAYANFCGDSSVEVITCDWGKCESKKL